MTEGQKNQGKKLTPKQQRFVEAFMLEPDPGKAAVAAGSTAKRARQAGYEFMTNPDVAAEINRLQVKRAERVQIDAQYVLTRLHDENEADLADLYDEENGALLPVHKWPLIWRKGLIQGVDVEELRDEGQVIGVVRKVKISDRIKRTELIGKHIGVNAFQEQVKVTGIDALAERLARAVDRAE